MRYKYTDKEINTLLKNIVIVIDSREQKNKHILDWLDKKKKRYKVEKLDQGDYSCYLESNEDTKELGILRDLYFSNNIVIERKNSVDELVQSFVSRDRFEDELKRCKLNGTKIEWLIEDENGFGKLMCGDYPSSYKQESAKGTYFTFVDRYKIGVNWLSSIKSGFFIYNRLLYAVREYLKG